MPATINLAAKSPETVNVWKVKAMQDKLMEAVELLFAEGLCDEAREILRTFDRVLDKAAD